MQSRPAIAAVQAYLQVDMTGTVFEAYDMRKIYPLILATLALAQPAEAATSALSAISARITQNPPRYDGYLLGSKYGRYPGLDCKPISASDLRLSTTKAVTLPAGFVCQVAKPSHNMNGKLRVTAEILIYRDKTLTEIWEVMDSDSAFREEDKVEQTFPMTGYSATFTVRKHVKKGTARGLLTIVQQGYHPESSKPRSSFGGIDLDLSALSNRAHLGTGAK